MSHTDHVPLEAMNIELSRQESVSSLGPAAGAREQLFPLRPLTKGQPVCENRSFPEELMMH